MGVLQTIIRPGKPPCVRSGGVTCVYWVDLELSLEALVATLGPQADPYEKVLSSS